MRNSTSFKHGAWLVALLSALALAGCEFDSLGGFDPAAQPRGYTPSQAPAQEDAGPGGHSD